MLTICQIISDIILNVNRIVILIIRKRQKILKDKTSYVSYFTDYESKLQNSKKKVQNLVSLNLQGQRWNRLAIKKGMWSYREKLFYISRESDTEITKMMYLMNKIIKNVAEFWIYS